MPASPTRHILLKTAPNLRGLGGLPVDGGNVPHGSIFRSASLSYLSDADGASLADLGIEVVFDLRTASERAQAPDRTPSSMRDLHLDVLADSNSDMAAALTGMGTDPTAINEALAGGKAEKLLEESYRDIVSKPSALAAYGTFYRTLTADDAPRASLFHCTTGKDRTGWAAASFLFLLGADDQTVRGDYLETNQDLLPAIQPLIDRAQAAGIDTDLIMPLLTVQDAYLDAALDELQHTFGSFEQYFTQGLGLSTELLDTLRERFITPTSA